MGLLKGSKIYFKILAGFLVFIFAPLATIWFLVSEQAEDVQKATLDEIRNWSEFLISENEKLLKQQARATARRKALDVEAQLEAYLDDKFSGHKPREDELIELADDAHFVEIASQKFGISGYTAVHTKTAICIAHPYPQMRRKNLSELSKDLPEFWNLILRGMKEEVWGEYEWFDETGKPLRKVMHLKPLDRYDLVIAATATLDEYLEPSLQMKSSAEKTMRDTEAHISGLLQALYRNLFIMLGILLVTAIFLSWYITRNIIAPIEEITAFIKSAPLTQPKTLKATSRNDEIGTLALEFSNMQERIKKYQDELLQSRKELEKKVEERTKELQKAINRLQTLDKSKDEFIWLVSHELKTPLTSIANCVEMLLSEEFKLSNEERNKYLNIIGEETARLNRLINNVLDITRMEAGTLPFNFRKVDILSLAERTVIQHQPEARKNGLQIKFKANPSADLLNVYADPDRIKQVLSNLINNAIKFTPSGGRITVSVDLITETDGKKFAQIEVSDTGIGIPEKDWDRIFEKFTQLEVEHHSTGSGLGLAIVKKIVEMHGGKVWVRSEEGKGSTFFFTIPIEGTKIDEPSQTE